MAETRRAPTPEHLAARVTELGAAHRHTIECVRTGRLAEALTTLERVSG